MNLVRFLKYPKPYSDKLFQKLHNFYRGYAYRGTQVVCNVCNWHGQKFFNNKCPVCNSLPRTRLVPYAIRHFNLDIKAFHVLHIAPNYNEYQFVKGQISDHSKYDRLNIRPVKHINIVQDLTNTTLKNEQYDLVIAWHVLEHIPKDVEAIHEVYRLLKPNGQFLVSVPIYPLGNPKTFEDASLPYHQYEQVHGHYDHCRSCGLDYYERFENAGFKTSELRINSIPLAEQNFYGLSNGHVVWCFQK